MKKFLIMAVLAVLFASPAFAAPGDLDTSFGVDGTGMVSTSFGEGLSLAENSMLGMCVQPDGKIIVVGTAATRDDKHFVLARYNTNGTLDTEFKSRQTSDPEYVPSPDGIVITNITVSVSTDVSARRCAVGTDGAIVVVGTYVTSRNQKRFVVARYLSNGDRDTAFSGNGLEGLAVGGGALPAQSEAMDVAIAPDGKIWVAGYWENAGGRHIAVARFNNACTGGNGLSSDCFDNTFADNGRDGTSAIPEGSTSEMATTIAVQADGKAVVGGQATVGGRTVFIIARYLAGACVEGECLDNAGGVSFNGTQGYVISTPEGGRINEIVLSVIINDDGKISAAGGSIEIGGPSRFVVRSYNADGTPDNLFGIGGTVYVNFALSYMTFDLFVHGEKMIASGVVDDPTAGNQTALTSLDASSGAPDETFAAGGHFTSPYPKGAFGVTVQSGESDGKIVVAGPDGAGVGFGLARFVGFYSPPSPPPPSPPPLPPPPPPPGGSASADLAISMAAVPAIGPVLPNQLAYNVTVSNAGPDSAEGVVATITLPDNVVFVSASDACARSGVTITCSMGAVAMGAGSPFEIRVTGSTEADMSYTANVTSTTTDSNAANNTALITTVKLSASEDPRPAMGEGDGGGCAMINGAGQKPDALIILMLVFLISPLVIARGLKYNG